MRDEAVHDYVTCLCRRLGQMPQWKKAMLHRVQPSYIHKWLFLCSGKTMILNADLEQNVLAQWNLSEHYRNVFIGHVT